MPIPAPAPAPAPAPSSPITTNVKFDDIRSVHVHSTWSNGLGDNRIVVVSERDDISVPVDGDDWNGNAEYNKSVYSTNDGGGILSSVVYKGSAENVTVYNLKAKTTYYFYFFEYDLVNDSPIYISEFTVENITTGGDEFTNNININVTDDITTLGIENTDITITNRKQHVISKGRSDDKGKYVTKLLPIGGVYIDIAAPGYDSVSLRSVYVKELTEKTKSSYKSSTSMTYDVRLIKTTTL